jgi:hypothetical protein
MNRTAAFGGALLLGACFVSGRGPVSSSIPSPRLHVIHRSADAPESVRLAASELQRALLVSTGIEAPISDERRSPMISLGDTAAAREAGLSAAELPLDGFRLVTRGSDLFIVGRDGPAPEPEAMGRVSRGTLFGTYDFLERVLGVRWLLPGEWGEDIPKHPSLQIPPLSVTDAPDFTIRGLSDIQERRPAGGKGASDVREWALRQRIPSLTDGPTIQRAHSWGDYGMPDVLKHHSEYAAVNGDPRKFCTSNADAVRAFADGVIRWFDTHPEQRSASISPSDGGGFCQCDRCRARVVPDPHGTPSYSLVILDFYNEVARQVAAKFPDRVLAGYMYYNYLYPPDNPPRVEPNVWLVWAPLNYYGWGLQKPAYRQEFPRVLAGWRGVTPRLIYHDYSTWMRALNGTPLPPGFDILRLELPEVRRAGVPGAEMVGVGAWGYGGPSNYILARQLWHADVDVGATWEDWLARAYGPGWQAMDQAYRLIEARMKARKEKESLAYRGEMYEVNRSLIEDVYVPVFAEIERLYLDALARTTSVAQRRRLEMFGDNLVMLHYGLRKAGLARDPERSTFYRTDEQYERFLADTEESIALYRGPGKRYTGPVWSGEWRGP